MSKTNETSRDQLTINDLNRELRDDELDAVSGGIIAILIGLSLSDGLALEPGAPTTSGKPLLLLCEPPAGR